MGEFKTVSAGDPAIDRERMTKVQMHAFSVDRDMKHLVMKPGARPVEFTFRDIPHRDFIRWVNAPDSEHEKYERAFECALQSVTNLPNADGTYMPTWEPPRTNDMMADEAMARFPAGVILELGGVAYRRSFFGQWTKPTYALPPLLAAHLNAQTYLPAAVSPTSPAENSGAALSPPGAEGSPQ